MTDMQLLASLQQLRGSRGRWALLMLRGGHFAAAVVQLKDTSGVKKGHAQEPFDVVAHKTFHRYVVR